MAMEALLCVVIIIVGSSMAESYIDDSLPVHSISTCTRTVMHRLDSSDLPSTSRKRLLASSVGTVMPPMLNINCNENGETDNVIFITDAEYGITTPGECDVMSSQRNATCRESAQRSQSITPCMLTGSCNIEGTPVLLQQCGKYSNYLKVEYQCLPGMSNVHGVCDDLSATDVTEVGHLTSPHYPSHYQESVACSCSITVPPGGHIQANLLDFRLEQHSQCTYDYLEFTDGRESRHRLCGEVSSGYKITSDAEQLNITFHSDDSIKFTGFWLSYKGIGRSSETSSVSLRCTAIPLPTEPPSHQNHANHGNSNDGSQDGNPDNRILVGNVAPRSRTDIVRDDSSTDIVTLNVTTRRSPVARNVQQLWQRHHEGHNLTFPLFVVPDGDVYQQPAAQGNQTTFISTNLAIVIGVCVGGLALMIIINAIGITICCRRMSHAKDASIYTSGTTSRTDTSVAILSSAASSVSTEYVSLNSTGASYHATGTAKRNAPKTYNTWTYDDSTYGTASRDNSLKTSRDQHRQIADSKYYIRDLLPCEQSDQRSLSGAQIDPLRYQIDPNRHTTGDGYYCKKGYTENIHNTTQNTDVYTDHTDRDSYNVDQCCLGENCIDGQCHESITSDQHLLHSTLTRYIPPHRMLVPSSVPPTHGYRGASTHTDQVQSNDFV